MDVKEINKELKRFDSYRNKLVDIKNEVVFNDGECNIIVGTIEGKIASYSLSFLDICFYTTEANDKEIRNAYVKAIGGGLRIVNKQRMANTENSVGETSVYSCFIKTDDGDKYFCIVQEVYAGGIGWNPDKAEIEVISVSIPSGSSKYGFSHWDTIVDEDELENISAKLAEIWDI